MMPFTAHVLKVFIASPGDTHDEREAVERALQIWNRDRSERETVVLLPQRWEVDAVPRLGSSGQGVVNQQLLDKADIVLAFFDSRLGRRTPAAVSGTAEEIQRAHEAGKPVHVWFSDEPIPRNADLAQVQAVQEFQRNLECLGLLGTYLSVDDLAYKVRQAVEADLEILELGLLEARRVVEEQTMLKAHHLSGPIPVLNVVFLHTPEGQAMRITLQNKGRTAVTARGVGLAFGLPDGGLRHIVMGLDTETRLDPEGAPQAYVVPEPVLRNLRTEGVQPPEIMPFVILGVETMYGRPMPAGLLELVTGSPSGNGATFHVFDAYDEYLRTAKLMPREGGFEDSEDDGSHTIVDQMYHSFLQAAPQMD